MGDDDMDANAFDDVEALDDLDEDFSLDAKKRGRRSVRLYNVLPKRVFDHSSPAAGTTMISLQRALKVPRFYYYWLAFRIHSAKYRFRAADGASREGR